jgi:hypothetical protein
MAQQKGDTEARKVATLASSLTTREAIFAKEPPRHPYQMRKNPDWAEIGSKNRGMEDLFGLNILRSSGSGGEKYTLRSGMSGAKHRCLFDLFQLSHGGMDFAQDHQFAKAFYTKSLTEHMMHGIIAYQ